MARVLQGPIVEEAVQGALESEAVKKALLEAMDSELVDEVWRRLLASEEAQQLVERIAEAPEVRAAISAQGAGLLEDIGRTIGKLTRRLDDSFERIVRRVFFRRRRAVASDHAGAVSRALAMRDRRRLRQPRLHRDRRHRQPRRQRLRRQRQRRLQLRDRDRLDRLARRSARSTWSASGRWPGRRRGCASSGSGSSVRAAAVRGARSKRLIGLGLSVVTFGIGFLGIVFGEQRRGWDDRFAATDVIYDERRPEPAPWSRPEPAEPVAAAVEPPAARRLAGQRSALGSAGVTRCLRAPRRACRR